MIQHFNFYPAIQSPYLSSPVFFHPCAQDAAPQHRPGRHHDPLPTWEEQGLCIGSTFAVAATNGIDPARRVNFLGFCQSVDILTDAVEDTVLSRGGEILEQERQLKR